MHNFTQILQCKGNVKIVSTLVSFHSSILYLSVSAYVCVCVCAYVCVCVCAYVCVCVCVYQDSFASSSSNPSLQTGSKTSSDL